MTLQGNGVPLKHCHGPAAGNLPDNDDHCLWPVHLSPNTEQLYESGCTCGARKFQRARPVPRRLPAPMRRWGLGGRHTALAAAYPLQKKNIQLDMYSVLLINANTNIIAAVLQRCLNGVRGRCLLDRADVGSTGGTCRPGFLPPLTAGTPATGPPMAQHPSASWLHFIISTLH